MPNQHFNSDNNTEDLPLLKSSPVLLYSGFIDKDANWCSPEHTHPFCEIVFICEGSGQFMIDGTLYTGHRGDILIYNAETAHDEYSLPSDPLKMYYCAIDNIVIHGLEEQHILPLDVDPLIKAGNFTMSLESFFNAIVVESSKKLSDYETMCSNLLSCIIISVLRYINTPKTDIMQEINTNSGISTKLYIDQNFTQDINLSKLSQVFYMSKDYLSHVFKNDIGSSPMKYLMERRIMEAKKLLNTTNMTISEISAAVGYDNANYFSVIFKKITGLTPNQYRKTEI